MSQPAMTQAIVRLEDQLDVRLFKRQVEGMIPTPFATLLYPRVLAMLGFINSKRVTHTQIRAFLALARGGTYSEAHHTTGLARASLHRAVSDLETTLKQDLVRRKGRGLELTEPGRARVRQYALAEAEMRAALEDIAEQKGDTAGRVSIGAMPLCRARVLPTAIVAFQRSRPECDLYVAEGSHGDLVEPLRNGDIDFMIGTIRDQSLAPDLAQKTLFEDHPVIIAKYDHPLPMSQDERLAVMACYDWCLPQRGVPLRDSWEDMFMQAGITPPKVKIECGSVITICQILNQTECLTVLSPEQVAVELEAKWLKIVGHTGPQMRRVIGLTHRENWRPTHAQKEFMTHLEIASTG